MNIKEKIIKIGKTVQNCRPIEKVKHSHMAMRIQRGVQFLQAHFFMTQIGLILFYRLALDAIYITALSPGYAYAGFTTDISIFLYLCSWLLVAVFAPFIAELNVRKSPSDIVVTIINYLYFIPLTSYCACKGTNIYFFLTAAVYWGVLLAWQFKLPILRIKGLPTHHVRLIMIVLTVFSSLLVMYVSGKYTGFRFTLDFINVYDIRNEASSYAIPTTLSYLLSMVHIVLAVLLLYWMQQKKYSIVAILTVVFLFLYSIAAHKSLFFFLLLLLAGYFFFREWMLRWLPALFSALVWGALLVRKVLGIDVFMSLFVRRVMYIPVQMSEEYALFFMDNPLNLFREGIMRWLSFDWLYTTNLPHIIGEFMGKPNMAANNGLLGELFGNFPVLLGILLLPLILVVCFRLLDMTAASLDTKIVLPICIYFANGFINSSWSTVLLSHGFLLACLLLYLFPKKEGLTHERT